MIPPRVRLAENIQYRRQRRPSSKEITLLYQLHSQPQLFRLGSHCSDDIPSLSPILDLPCDRLSTATMDFSSSNDPKPQIMNQIRQEAAVNNARALINVRSALFLFYNLPTLTRVFSGRNSTATASRNAYPVLDHPCRAAKKHAYQRVWRSTWRHGIRSAKCTYNKCKKRQGRRQMGEDLAWECKAT